MNINRKILIMIGAIAFYFSSACYAMEFVKQQLLFLPWGNGEKQIGYSEKNGAFIGPDSLGVDASENYYIFDACNNRVLKFSKSGLLIRTVVCEKTCIGMQVDESGNIFLPMFDKKINYSLGIVKPDQTIEKTDQPWSDFISDGIIFDRKTGKPVSVYGKAGMSGPVISPKLIFGIEWDRKKKDDNSGKDSIVFHPSERLKNHYRTLFENDVTADLPIDRNSRINSFPIGIDEKGNIFVAVGYFPPVGPGPIEKSFVYVYAKNGEVLGVISLNVDRNGWLNPDLFKVDNLGDLYHLESYKDGVYLFKWSH